MTEQEHAIIEDAVTQLGLVKDEIDGLWSECRLTHPALGNALLAQSAALEQRLHPLKRLLPSHDPATCAFCEWDGVSQVIVEEEERLPCGCTKDSTSTSCRRADPSVGCPCDCEDECHAAADAEAERRFQGATQCI